MKQKCLFLPFLFFFIARCYAEPVKIEVKNTLNFDRNGEIVALSAVGLSADFNAKSYILKDAAGKEVAYQLSVNKGLPSLIFQANVPAESAVIYTLEEGTPASVAPIAYARFVPERSDDFAWENDIAAFRMYGPALAKIEYPSNGVDIWMKSADEPVMDRIYAGRLSGNDSYHENNGLGLDCYDVKHTMGAGGVAPYTSQFWIGNQFSSYEIVEKGPLRCVFTLIYDTIKVEDTYYRETLTITTEAGSLLNKAVVRFEGVEKPIKLATGIFMHGEKVNTFYDKENKVISYVKNAVSNKKVPQGQTYIGVYAPEASGAPFEADNHYLILNDYQVGKDLTYYFGGGWSKWKFPTEDDWTKALLRFSRSKQEPLTVRTISGAKNYVRMSDSEIVRNPKSWMLDFSPAPKWNYCHGLVLLSIQKAFEKTGDKKYEDYVVSYPNTMLLENGKKILTYNPDNYNIDHVNPGRILFPLYRETGDEKYKNALNLLRAQMATHPRTSEGGFWHKKVYPYQMWLDGIYMASPFLAEYAKTFDEKGLYDDVAHQIILIAKKTLDAKTGLYYHGWDEKREQIWANPKTGLSPNFWSRSIGWYAMAMVDVLDFLPENHPKRPEIIKILNKLAASLEKYRDPASGLWYQVTDKLGAEGNYLESTGSIMFIYFWVKGAQKGYLAPAYLEKGKKAYDRFVNRFIAENPDGTISVTDCCSVAGLGGKENRDGSYKYYISEPVRDNDPKATGPFILTSLLLDK